MDKNVIISADPLDLVLERIGGKQEFCLYVAEISLAAGVTTRAESTPIQVPANTPTVVAALRACCEHTTGGYNGVQGPVVPAFRSIEPDAAGVGGVFDLDHPVMISAKMEMVNSDLKQQYQDKLIPLSALFDSQGVYVPQRPFIIEGNTSITFRITPSVAPGVATRVMIVLEVWRCQGGKLP